MREIEGQDEETTRLLSRNLTTRIFQDDDDEETLKSYGEQKKRMFDLEERMDKIKEKDERLKKYAEEKKLKEKER